MSEELRSIAQRDRLGRCECGAQLTLLISRPHVAPDGVYSYAPNLGSESAFERRQQAIKDGIKVMPKIQ